MAVPDHEPSPAVAPPLLRHRQKRDRPPGQRRSRRLAQLRTHRPHNPADEHTAHHRHVRRHAPLRGLPEQLAPLRHPGIDLQLDAQRGNPRAAVDVRGPRHHRGLGQQDNRRYPGPHLRRRPPEVERPRLRPARTSAPAQHPQRQHLPRHVRPDHRRGTAGHRPVAQGRPPLRRMVRQRAPLQL